MENQKVTAIIGGQFGSEGKGAIVAKIASQYDIHVRVGAPNAGHSFYFANKTWKMQSIPCGWRNYASTLVIGAGAVINLDILRREIEEIAAFDSHITSRLFIDGNAAIIDPILHDEGHTEGEMHKRIGSTGEGVGLCRQARIARNPQHLRQFRDICRNEPYWAQFQRDTVSFLNSEYQEGQSILLEGAQGIGLSLIHGDWPYCTSTDCGAAQLCADSGLSPLILTDVLAVFRTHPIRVAGNSGKLYNEIDWNILSKLIGKDVCEKTTVTKKIRRVGMWDESLALKCKMLNRPTQLAVTFVDYIDKDDEGVAEYERLSKQTKAFVAYLEDLMGAPVKFIGTGTPAFTIIER